MDYKGLSKEIVDKSCERLRIGYLNQLNDLLIQGCLFFGPIYIRQMVITSLNIIDTSIMPEDIREASDQFEKDNPDLPL